MIWFLRSPAFSTVSNEGERIAIFGKSGPSSLDARGKGIIAGELRGWHGAVQIRHPNIRLTEFDAEHEGVSAANNSDGVRVGASGLRD